MRNEVFVKMDTDYARHSGETEQEYMERIMTAVNEEDPDLHTYNETIGPKYISCDAEEESVTFEFLPQAWQANQGGILHGGITASVHDICMGIVAKYYLPERASTVTMQMNMEFLRPVPMDGPVRVKAFCEKHGRRVCYTRCEITDGRNGKLLSSANGIYM